jgi:hypothetical protein
MVNDQWKLMTIRGLFEFNLDPISIDEVEPWTEIEKIQNRCHVLWIHQPRSTWKPGDCHEELAEK